VTGKEVEYALKNPSLMARGTRADYVESLEVC